MDEALSALAGSLAGEGPLWALTALGGAAFFLRVWPAVERRMAKSDEREDRREERKAEESRLREEHDREQARLQGQWLEQQDRSNAAMEASNAVAEGLRVELAALNENLRDSKDHSRAMGEAIGSMVSKVDDIHRRIVKED